ncbi:hypothetical protein C9374_009719 [Naegleria lovaniensis]|uniref:Uncharacterized protein n=1 Tax=Naegleria lovaniensis TaxID=51637 RepID=A0AA88KRD3_NAELO|nr:uncharacterized protein C9374_009719 [Naegleria lovaniensis]KAG2393142.1 hypothetical protein C9374_009719 [Naegleria lovaniensis]
MMNGKFTDKAFFIKPVQNTTTTYAEYMDNYLRNLFDEMKAYLTSIGSPVCDQCVERMKFAYCANAFPKYGYVSCISNELLTYLGEMGKACKGFCCAETSGLCVVDESGNTCDTKPLSVKESVTTLTCMTPYLGKLFSKLSSCNQHFVALDICTDMLSTCDCSNAPSVYDTTCKRFFTDAGTKFDNYPNSGVCSNVANPGWCKAARSNVVEHFRDSMTDVRQKMLDFLDPVLHKTNQYIPTTDPLKADIAKGSIGTPVPFIYPTLKRVTFSPPYDDGSLKYRLACSGDKCVVACTNPKSYVYNPYAEKDSGTCNLDPFYMLTLLAENAVVIGVVVALVVLFLLCITGVIVGFCIFCCCCRDRRKLAKQGKRERLDKDKKTSKLQNAADKFLSKF